MNQNETRTFWISVGAALFAVFLLYSYTQEKSAQLTKKFGAKQRVVIAAQDINEMETIDETMLQVIERPTRSEEHTSELQSLSNLVCRLLLEIICTVSVRTPAAWKTCSRTTVTWTSFAP